MEQTMGDKFDVNTGVLYNLYEKTEDTRYTVTKNFRSYNFDYSWVDTVPPLIAHAFGGIDGNTYTNSREAFLYNYDRGYRIFEVDFGLTSPENTLVAVHEMKEWREMTGRYDLDELDYDSFKSEPLCGQYTSMDYKDVIDLMVEYPDIYIVTDSKYTDRSSVLLEFSQLVRYAEDTDPSVLDRIIPQIYHEEMLEWVMDVYSFKSVIYTLYQVEWTSDEVEQFCDLTGVKMVTLAGGSEDTIEWNKQGLIVSAFTINELDQAKELMDNYGISLLYTDFLDPEDF
jgi:glycerophosphoryl diester phosphodiesterase